MITAPPRSTASVPRPIASVRYPEAKGTTVAAQPMLTNGSKIAVSTCSARKATENSASVRCTSGNTNRGQRRGAEPRRDATPSTITALNMISSVSPLARETYHRSWDPAAAAAMFIVHPPVVFRDADGCPVGQPQASSPRQ